MKKTLFLYACLMMGSIIGGSLWAVQDAAIWDSLRILWQYPWFQVTLLDLYLGFGLVSLFIFYLEQSFIKVCLWTLALIGFGNGITGLYMLRMLYENKKHNLVIGEKKNANFRLF